MDKIEFSVVIPTYNRASLIRDTLLSVMDQTHPPAEVVVVDDGSSDNTEQVVRGIGRDLRYHKISNSGQSQARNTGVGLTSAAWIAFCDSDDLWHPEKLQRINELLPLAPEVSYLFSNFRVFSEGQGRTGTTKFDAAPDGFWEANRRIPAPQFWVYDESLVLPIIRFQPIFPSTVVMRRQLFDDLGGFDPSMRGNQAEDFEFALRCANRPPIGVVAEPLVEIRKHTGNVSGHQKDQLRYEIAILEHCLAHHNPSDEVRQAAEASIALRSMEAAELAYREGELELTRELLDSAAPLLHLPGRVRLKRFLASLPHPVAEPIRRLSVRLSDLRSSS